MLHITISQFTAKSFQLWISCILAPVRIELEHIMFYGIPLEKETLFWYKSSNSQSQTHSNALRKCFEVDFVLLLHFSMPFTFNDSIADERLVRKQFVGRMQESGRLGFISWLLRIYFYVFASIKRFLCEIIYSYECCKKFSQELRRISTLSLKTLISHCPRRNVILNKNLERKLFEII